MSGKKNFKELVICTKWDDGKQLNYYLISVVIPPNQMMNGKNIPYVNWIQFSRDSVFFLSSFTLLCRRNRPPNKQNKNSLIFYFVLFVVAVSLYAFCLAFYFVFYSLNENFIFIVHIFDNNNYFIVYMQSDKCKNYCMLFSPIDKVERHEFVCLGMLWSECFVNIQIHSKLCPLWT